MTYSLDKLGIASLNPMQEQMGQLFAAETHLVLLSPTGSGKTLAYVLPLLREVDARADELQALVLVPSRELAMQTDAVVKSLSTPVRSQACYGGRATMEEHRTLRATRPHVLIGTPGRVLDHLQKGNIAPGGIHTLVIDEFDKCLELGFQAQMSELIGALPSVRRRVLLSATDCEQIPIFVGTEHFRRLDFLSAGADTAARIRQWRVASPQKDKLETLYRLLCMLGEDTSLVFVNYRESVERVGDYLRRAGISAALYHGGMEQHDRERALFRFRNGSANVLVSTDLASRGLDIAGISNVVHYHLPPDEEAYIHRNGRTARWDATGNALLILGPEEQTPPFVTGSVEPWHVPERVPQPAAPRWVALYVGKGKRDKVNRVDIVGFLIKAGGLERGQIGRIDVLPNWSYVAVERSVAHTLIERVRGQKIKGVKTIIALADA